VATVTLKGVKKVYEGNVTAVHDFDLEIKDKEFVVLVGPSGCGKSTTLRAVAGLEDISEGDIYIGDRRVNDIQPKDRDIAMVFQNYALYPHMTVYQNMAFALQLRKLPKKEIDRKVREAAEILDISKYLDRKPKALSGGQRQRVAIGRAIVREPAVFLMDEPLSNLDAKLRNQMRAEIIKLRQKINTTFIYVTHDQTEAITLGDRIVIMKDGYIQQTGTPREVFNQPKNLFVAGFIGTPQMNFFDAELRRDTGGIYRLDVGGADIALSSEKQDALKTNNAAPRRVTAGVRPDSIVLCGETAGGQIPATVEVAELTGSHTNLHVSALGTEVIIVVRNEDRFVSNADFAFGDRINFTFGGNVVHLFDRETGENVLSAQGAPFVNEA
jgi:multiple sugar transport system ATP-binding protein